MKKIILGSFVSLLIMGFSINSVNAQTANSPSKIKLEKPRARAERFKTKPEEGPKKIAIQPKEEIVTQKKSQTIDKKAIQQPVNNTHRSSSSVAMPKPSNKPTVMPSYIKAAPVNNKK